MNKTSFYLSKKFFSLIIMVTKYFIMLYKIALLKVVRDTYLYDEIINH